MGCRKCMSVGFVCKYHRWVEAVDRLNSKYKIEIENCSIDPSACCKRSESDHSPP